MDQFGALKSFLIVVCLEPLLSIFHFIHHYSFLLVPTFLPTRLLYSQLPAFSTHPHPRFAPVLPSSQPSPLTLFLTLFFLSLIPRTRPRPFPSFFLASHFFFVLLFHSASNWTCGFPFLPPYSLVITYRSPSFPFFSPSPCLALLLLTVPILLTAHLR
ncbi:hypothetical protein C8R47DRAFT_1147268 [Mycena vitilis]|nr:hypothetical protein C8R47DRAFT_1147268 [Mycena vitilis]